MYGRTRQFRGKGYKVCAILPTRTDITQESLFGSPRRGRLFVPDGAPTGSCTVQGKCCIVRVFAQTDGHVHVCSRVMNNLFQAPRLRK